MVFAELRQRRLTSSQACVGGLPALKARRPKEAFVHGRRSQERKSPFSQKTCVFCLQRGLSSSHTLFFNMEPRKNKKKQMCSFLSEVHLEAGNSGLLWAYRARPRVLSAANIQPHVALHQPGKPRGKLKCPLGASWGGCLSVAGIWFLQN